MPCQHCSPNTSSSSRKTKKAKRRKLTTTSIVAVAVAVAVAALHCRPSSLNASLRSPCFSHSRSTIPRFRMLPTYHRSSSAGMELEPLNGKPASTVPPPLLGNGNGNGTSPSPYHHVRDLLVSVSFFLLGWFGPKYLKPSEEYLEEREIPYQVLSTGDVVLDQSLNYPLVEPPTVPSSKLIMFSILIPIILMSVVGLVGQRSFHVSVKGISSLLLAVGGSEGTTQLLKTWVLRRRPNFYHLCQFSPETLACQGDYHSILESQMSFPSGHSSLSWCGMVVLVWFLIVGNKQLGKVYMFVCTVLPLGAATFVATSRIVDHWHHPSDVLTGVFLGCLWGTIGYHVHDCVKPLPIGRTAAPSTKLPSFHD